MQQGNDHIVGANLLMNTKKKLSSSGSEASYRSSGKKSDRIIVDVGSRSVASSEEGGFNGKKSIKRIKRSNYSHSSGSSYTGSDVSSDDATSVTTDSDDASSVTRSDTTYSTSSSVSEAPRKKLSQEEIMNMKRELLYQFDRLEKKGVKLPRKFTLASSLEEMRAEYERLKCDREVEISIRFQRKMLMAIITGVEFMNSRFDPFDIKLDGWSESVNDSINDYDDIFEELYMKYRGKAKMAPELKLMFMLGGSAFMYHLSNTMFKSVPGLDQVMKQNPDLMRQFASATMNTMAQEKQNSGGGGLGGILGSLMGGGGGLSSLFGMAMGGGPKAPAPMPPPQPSNNVRSQMRGPTNVDDILNELNLNTTPSAPNAQANMNMQDRVETMSTVSDSDISEIPDDASVSGVFATKPRVIKRSGGRSIDI